MCLKCKLPDTLIGLHDEFWATDGCVALWRTWCEQNAEKVELEVIDWLYRNSQCLRIMGLHGLPPPGMGPLKKVKEKKTKTKS